jgi:Tfp pilus assembly major pilin PilA
MYRSGFTWKELCCALGIIGLILALISIPVQKARRAAVRTADQ